jgi:drug/metabolite transporter (DMT)-like permease
VKTVVCTALALVAFAMNSVLCRLALGKSAIDAASFSSIRLCSGAIILLLIVRLSRSGAPSAPRHKWTSPVLLFLYAATFAFAYISLSVGTGALILFGSVQATMIITALVSGERPGVFEWAGLSLALGGLVYLVFPGLAAPSITSSLLMIVAGISWGFYSVLGRSTVNPLADTVGNFLRAVPFAIGVSLLMASKINISGKGVMLAVISGALTSGMGYVIWYAALRGLTATRAATVQLAVPVLAAIGGIVLLSEDISLRLVLAGILILGGIGITLSGRTRVVKKLEP